MTSDQTSIHWFRQDLRTADNPALLSAAGNGRVIPVFILDDLMPDEFHIGGACKVWLHHSLDSLNKSLNGHLRCFRGDPEAILENLCKKYHVKHITWNRVYDPWRIEQDTKLKAKLHSIGIKVQSFNGSLLWEPWETLKADGTPYRVFTPFYKNGCLNANVPRTPLKTSEIYYHNEKIDPNNLNDLGLLDNQPWETDLISKWRVGESGASAKLKTYLSERIKNYSFRRNK